MKSLIILLFAAIMSSNSFDLEGQSVDQSKMDKDLEVSKNVLSSLMENATKNRFMWRFGDNIEAKYRSGFGVIYAIKNSFPAIVTGYANSAQSFVVGRSKVKIAQAGENKTENGKEESNDNVNQLKIIAMDFMMNYHNLVRQLKPTDRIMVKTTSNRNKESTIFWNHLEGQNRQEKMFSIEALLSDLTSFSSGEISEQEMMKKFIVKDISVSNQSEPAIEVFSAAFGRLYQSDLTDSYYMTGYPWHERTDGFGLTYYLKFYSSTQINEFYNLPTFKKTNLELTQRNEIVESAYPEFKDALKENMLDYGHLLKNLKSSEFLIFNVELTQCINCNMPKSIELKVKKSVIDQYRNGSLSLQDAKNKIEETILES